MKTNKSTASDEPSESTVAQIQARAYQLYVEEGRQDGHDMEHWLRAEKMLREQPVVLNLDAVPAIAEKGSFQRPRKPVEQTDTFGRGEERDQRQTAPRRLTSRAH